MSDLPPDDRFIMNGLPNEPDFLPPPLDWLDAPTDDYVDIGFLFDDEWDIPADEQLDALFADSIDLIGLELEDTTPSLDKALAAIGLTRDSDIPLSLDSPPLVHADSGSRLWFGVLQPDPQDDSQAFVGILSEREGTVDFAPVIAGDSELAYQQAAQLLGIAETQGLDYALAQALQLSVEHQQFEHWQHEWGTSLPDGPSQQVRDYLSDLEL